MRTSMGCPFVSIVEAPRGAATTSREPTTRDTRDKRTQGECGPIISASNDHSATLSRMEGIGHSPKSLAGFDLTTTMRPGTSAKALSHGDPKPALERRINPLSPIFYQWRAVEDIANETPEPANRGERKTLTVVDRAPACSEHPGDPRLESKTQRRLHGPRGPGERPASAARPGAPARAQSAAR